MIELLIFHAHIVFALYVFTKNKIERNLKSGVLALGVIGLTFTVGWALTGPIAQFIMPGEGTPFFDKDTLSLVLISVPEAAFYYFFFLRDDPKPAEKNFELN